MSTPTPEIMRTRDAAAYLQVAEQTLEAWRRLKKGPPFVKVGRAVRYRKVDLDSWLESKRQLQEWV